MNFEKLVKGIKNCKCGKSHTCPIKAVVIEKNATEKLSSLTEIYDNILIVADNNTYKVLGEKVESVLSNKTTKTLVYNRKGVLVPDETAIEEMQNAVNEVKNCSLIIGIGSGVINDLCKVVAFNNKLPYYIVATAPSMDGYASKGSALILNGMKVTLNANVPTAIIADTLVLKDAPFDMIQAGYGDIIGKYSCLNDWLLSKTVLNEYFCDYIYNETLKVVEKTVQIADKLISRDEEAIGSLMEGLVAVGIYMAYVGNSRPASGSEHHLSHYFEIVGILNKEDYYAHGIDVCYSAIETSFVREQLLKLDNVCEFNNTFDKAIYESEINRIYKALSSEIFALQDKVGFYKQDRLPIYKEKWQEIKNVLKIAPTKAEMQALVEKIGLKYSDFVKFYGNDKIKDAIYYSKDLKDRYTVLWLYFDLYFNK